MPVPRSASRPPLAPRRARDLSLVQPATWAPGLVAAARPALPFPALLYFPCLLLLLAALLALGASHAAAAESRTTDAQDAQEGAEHARLLDAARTIMAGDRYPTLISVDEDGQPRARTVEVSVPDADMTLWVATRPNTRKVDQLRAAPQVTLHYARDAEGSYVSVMGTATLHDDAETIDRHRFQSDESLAAFWPVFPEDYLLIRIRPSWIEVLGAGVEAAPKDWRPPAICFEDTGRAASPQAD